jgi:serine/threonine protein kinase
VIRELEAGDVLDERFLLVEVISRSGMACIYKALDRERGQFVAVKVPLFAFEGNVVTYERFQREETIGLQLDHPFILKIHPTNRPKSRPYLVMDLLEGETLHHAMHTTRPLPEEWAAQIGSSVCAALHHMHAKGIVHRDLKPENIMLCRDGGIRVFDFGLAKVARMRRLTFTAFSATMGTPDYMAPEQVRGRRGDHRSDLYSLGAILYEMVTGKTPFEGDTPLVVMNVRTTGDPLAPRRINAQLTPVIEEIILHAMARNPADRYASAAQMKAELDDYERVKITGRCRRLEPTKPWTEGDIAWRVTAAVVGLYFAAVGLVFWYFSLRGRH